MTNDMPARPTRFRTSGLSPRKPTRFFYHPDAAALAALAGTLGLSGLKDLDFTGEIVPVGRDELLLTGQLKAQAIQSCVISLAPVPALISETVRRRYVAGLAEPEADEIEVPEDDSTEPMPETIDIADIATEALMLALPLYPRAPGAELGSMTHAASGVTPLQDADLKPFAGLSELAGRLAARNREDGSDKG